MRGRKQNLVGFPILVVSSISYADTCEYICKNMYIKMSEEDASVLPPSATNSEYL